VRWETLPGLGCPTYTAVHHVLTNPAYAGAYAYGKTRQERRVDETGTVQLRRRPLAASDWEVLIRDHHEGFIHWDTYQANQARINANIRPVAAPDAQTQTNALATHDRRRARLRAQPMTRPTRDRRREPPRDRALRR
jgi:Recombinase